MKNAWVHAAKGEKKKEKNNSGRLGLGCGTGIISNTRDRRQKRVPKPRDFCLMVTVAETGWGARFPFLT